jgi:hypothetical protein
MVSLQGFLFWAQQKRFHAACPEQAAKTRRGEPAGLLRQMTA